MSNKDQKNRGPVHQLSLLIVLINCTAGLSVYFFLTHSLLLLAGMITESILALVPIYLNHRGYPKRAAFALYMVIAAASFFFCSIIGNATIANLMGVVLIVSGGIFFSDQKNRIWSYLIAILVVWGVQENHVVGLIPEIKLGQLNYFRLLLTASIVVVFLVFTFVGWLHQPLERRVRQLLLPFSVTIRNKYKSLVEYGGVDIGLIFKETEDRFRQLANKKGVRLFFNVYEGFPEKIQINEKKLRSILAHLVRNAIQFSSSDTTVRVRAYMTELRLYIVVEDQGFGIAPDMRNRLFEPGTSLYTTKKLVLALGGTIEVVNKGMDGAMFIVSWLPPYSG